MGIAELFKEPIDDKIADCDPRDWSKASRAVIASNGKTAILVWYVGAHIEAMIEGVGNTNTDDLGFEHAPPEGISVWEGKTVGGERNWHTGDYNDCYLRGEYRAPTDGEWQSIQMNQCPWDADQWLLPDRCKGCGYKSDACRCVTEPV